MLALHAHDFAGMFRDLAALADATGVDARPLESKLRRRIDAVTKKARRARTVRVFCMEWFDPPYSTGHWVPEMVELAGGRDGLARPGKDSVRVEWSAIAKFAPEKMVLMPCGFRPARARRELPVLRARAEWRALAAVKAGEVWLADGPAFFNGAGPRLVDGLEILAEILHPEIFPRRHRRGYAQL